MVMEWVRWGDTADALDWWLSVGAQNSDMQPVEQPVENPETVELVKGMLAGLDDRQRQIAELHGMAGLEFSEVGTMMGLSSSTVRYHWWKVVEKLTGVAPPQLESKRERWARDYTKRQRDWKGYQRRTFGQPVPAAKKHNASTYTNYRCRCEACVVDHARLVRESRARRKAQRKPTDSP